jgi:hypothetical protein
LLAVGWWVLLLGDFLFLFSCSAKFGSLLLSLRLIVARHSIVGVVIDDFCATDHFKNDSFHESRFPGSVGLPLSRESSTTGGINLSLYFPGSTQRYFRFWPFLGGRNTSEFFSVAM